MRSTLLHWRFTLGGRPALAHGFFGSQKLQFGHGRIDIAQRLDDLAGRRGNNGECLLGALRIFGKIELEFEAHGNHSLLIAGGTDRALG